MGGPSIYATPTGSQNHAKRQTNAARKRKRRGHDGLTQSMPPREDSETSEVDQSQPVEYTAVLTPAERSQRRLAGLPLDQEPPPFPFPHASLPSKTDGQADSLEIPRSNYGKSSLHSQHLAAMTALLHRCMIAHDYVRAGRALGLLLRNAVGGQAIDIRSEGFWGIGAEILLRKRKDAESENQSSNVKESRITREGFERARLYYERLMIQYPRHKTWPDAVNSIDFCIAMFGLWVYVTNQEALELRQKASPSEDEEVLADEHGITLLDAKRWELEQARQIAEDMDTYMRSVPYVDDPELIRLRAMVALWTADLLDDCTRLDSEDESSQAPQLQEQSRNDSDGTECMIAGRNRTVQVQFDTNESLRQRSLANGLMNRLSQASHETVG